MTITKDKAVTIEYSLKDDKGIVIDSSELSGPFFYIHGMEETLPGMEEILEGQKVGFTFHLENFSHQNPKYIITFKGTTKSILGFSKRYDDVENKNPFIAITTCNNADTNCPFISEAVYRFHLPFVDPKSSDDTELEDETYLKTSVANGQILRYGENPHQKGYFFIGVNC